MPLQLNLEKSQAALKLCLEKVGIAQPPKMDMGVGLDVSGSFDDEHQDGTTNLLVSRLVPWGLTFDPDGKLDLATFSDGARHVQMVESVTAKNYENFVKRHVIRKVAGWGGGTTYSHVMHRFLEEFGWIQPDKPGFVARLFGAREAPAVAKRRSLVIVITDGENTDPRETDALLRDSEARQDQVFFLFLAVSNQGGKFPFLHQIDQRHRNCGVVVVDQVRQFVKKSDDEINEMLLLPKLVDWLKR